MFECSNACIIEKPTVAVKKKNPAYFDFPLRKINFSAHLPSISSLLMDGKIISYEFGRLLQLDCKVLSR